MNSKFLYELLFLSKHWPNHNFQNFNPDVGLSFKFSSVDLKKIQNW